jgi:hypothetical protein
MQEKKTAGPVNFTPLIKSEALGKLYGVLRNHKGHLSQMESRQGFNENKRRQMRPGTTKKLDRSMSNYDVKIKRVAALVKETEERIEEEKRKESRKDTRQSSGSTLQSLKDDLQLQILEKRDRELRRNLAYYHSLKEFASLEPQGMELLLRKLRFDNVPILDMVTEVKKVRSS